MLDTTLRPVCFKIPNESGPEGFKKYEHALYTLAQLSRIVYCDSGIAYYVLKHLGRSNDIVNKLISAYDAKYASTRRAPITSQPGDGSGRPMESYSLVPSKGAGIKYGTYISTPSDLTLLFTNASKITQNPNSIFRPTDVIITFKGSSTMKNLKHDLLSQFTPSDFAELLSAYSTGIQSKPGNKVAGAFMKPILKAWAPIMQAMNEHIKPGCRLFLTGHSLGGAYTTLFGLILAEGRSVIPSMKNVESIHIVSFGSPTILSDTARNTFNAHLDSGFITFDRVVNQKVASRSAATQLLVGGIVGPNDVIATIPAGFTHLGYKPLATELNPESNGRPYSIDSIRTLYGAPSKTRYRDVTTWPFPESPTITGSELNQIVKDLTGLTALPETPAIKTRRNSQTGGGMFSSESEKDKYSRTTKEHIPNFVSVQGSPYAYGFAHAEYLGMFFLGGFRLAGMKNPAASSIAYFELFDDGVKIKYVPKNPTDILVEPNTSESPTVGVLAPVGGKRTVSRKKKSIRRRSRSSLRLRK